MHKNGATAANMYNAKYQSFNHTLLCGPYCKYKQWGKW